MGGVAYAGAVPNRRGKLDPRTERELARRAAGGDTEAREALVTAMLPLVRQIARAYVGRGEPIEDLVQVGALGLVKAIDRFDLERNVRLTTFATPTISGEIKRHFRDRAWAMRTPRELQELYAALRSASDAYEAAHGNRPSIPELCALTGRSEEDVLDALSAGSNFRTASLDAPAGDDDGTVGDMVGMSDPGFGRAESRAMIARSSQCLSDRERTVLTLHYVRGMTQREIAEQIGVSQMHVSRLLRKALERLREHLT